VGWGRDGTTYDPFQTSALDITAEATHLCMLAVHGSLARVDEKHGYGAGLELHGVRWIPHLL
jgi:hypothetical protein